MINNKSTDCSIFRKLMSNRTSTTRDGILNKEKVFNFTNIDIDHCCSIQWLLSRINQHNTNFRTIAFLLLFYFTSLFKALFVPLVCFILVTAYTGTNSIWGAADTGTNSIWGVTYSASQEFPKNRKNSWLFYMSSNIVNIPNVT